jgi:cytochrome c oxidase assembly factor CtaG
VGIVIALLIIASGVFSIWYGATLARRAGKSPWLGALIGWVFWLPGVLVMWLVWRNASPAQTA